MSPFFRFDPLFLFAVFSWLFVLVVLYFYVRYEIRLYRKEKTASVTVQVFAASQVNPSLAINSSVPNMKQRQIDQFRAYIGRNCIDPGPDFTLHS